MLEDARGEERQALERLRDLGVLNTAEFDVAMARLSAAPQPRPVQDHSAPEPSQVHDQPPPRLPDPPRRADHMYRTDPVPGGWPPAAPGYGTAPPPPVTWTSTTSAIGTPPSTGAWSPQTPVSSAAPQAPLKSTAPQTGAADLLGEVRVPPQLVAAGQRLAALGRRVVGGDGAHLWVAAGTAAVLVSVLQTLLVLLTAGEALDEVTTNPGRAAVAVFAVATPAALHAAIIQGSGSGLLAAVGEITTHPPPTLLTVLLLSTFGLMARRRWRHQPLQDMAAVRFALVQAVVAFTGVAVLAALVTTMAGSLFVGEGPHLRAGLWSTAWWAVVFATPTAMAAIAPLVPRVAGSGQPQAGWASRPLALEALAAVRGALTGTAGLLILALMLVAGAGIHELAISGGQDVVAGTTTTVLLLPTALIVVGGLALAVPVTVEMGGPLPGLAVGDPAATIGLRGIEGVTGSAVGVPVWFWLIFLVAFLVLVLAGTGATWRAATAGVKATRAGMAVGPMMAVLWLPLCLVASATVRVEDGASGADLVRFLRDVGLPTLSGARDGGLRIGLAGGVLFATLLLVGALAGWLGSLLAKRLWGRTPAWVMRLLGGHPRGASLPAPQRPW